MSRLLEHPEQRSARERATSAGSGDHLGLAPLDELGATLEARFALGASADADVSAFATAIGPLGPVRAARWNRQLPASAGVAPGADGTASPNA